MDEFSEKETSKFNGLMKTEGKRILFYHGDPDGVCSAALMLKCFPDLEHAPREGPMIKRGFIEEIVDARPSLLIFVDLPVDQEWKQLDIIKKKLPEMKMIIIDHHTVIKDLNDNNVLHINPRFTDKDIYLPASFLVHELLKKLNKIADEYCWIASIGIIGDYARKECNSFLKECKGKFKGIERAFELVSAGISLRGPVGAHEILDMILCADSLSEFLKTKKLVVWKTEVDEELKRCIKEAEEGKEIHADVGLRIYPVNTELSLSAVISTGFSEKYPDDVIMVVKRKGGVLKLSMRCQSGRVNVAETARKAAKGIGSAGGHPKAAGGVIKDWKLFKSRFLKELKQKK